MILHQLDHENVITEATIQGILYYEGVIIMQFIYSTYLLFSHNDENDQAYNFEKVYCICVFTPVFHLITLLLRVFRYGSQPNCKDFIPYTLQCVFCDMKQAQGLIFDICAIQYDIGWAINCFWFDRIKFEAGCGVTLIFKMIS